MNRLLYEIASVIRSKNAGPYELTFDIFFKNEADYFFIKQSHFFSKELIARLYGVNTDKITRLIYFDPASAIKITMIRPVVSGAIGDTDIYGAQQHAPLLFLQVPIDKP